MHVSVGVPLSDYYSKSSASLGNFIIPCYLGSISESTLESSHGTVLAPVTTNTATFYFERGSSLVIEWLPMRVLCLHHWIIAGTCRLFVTASTLFDSSAINGNSVVVIVCCLFTPVVIRHVVTA